MQQAKQICTKRSINLIRWEVQSNNERAINFYNKLGATMKEKGIFRWKFDPR